MSDNGIEYGILDISSACIFLCYTLLAQNKGCRQYSQVKMGKINIRHISLPEFWWVWLIIDIECNILYVNDSNKNRPIGWFFVWHAFKKGSKPREENAAVPAFLAAGERRREVAPRKAQAARRLRGEPLHPHQQSHRKGYHFSGIFFAPKCKKRPNWGVSCSYVSVKTCE